MRQTELHTPADSASVNQEGLSMRTGSEPYFSGGHVSIAGQNHSQGGSRPNPSDPIGLKMKARGTEQFILRQQFFKARQVEYERD
jgi:hypothetical protein